jgi:hypothetical protein
VGVLLVILVFLFRIGAKILWVLFLTRSFLSFFFVRDWVPLVLPYNKTSLLIKKWFNRIIVLSVKIRRDVVVYF